MSDAAEADPAAVSSGSLQASADAAELGDAARMAIAAVEGTDTFLGELIRESDRTYVGHTVLEGTVQRKANWTAVCGRSAGIERDSWLPLPYPAHPVLLLTLGEVCHKICACWHWWK